MHNEKAANDLLDAVEKAIMERLPSAESFEPFRSVKERQYKYYRIYIKNFAQTHKPMPANIASIGMFNDTRTIFASLVMNDSMYKI